MIRSNHEGETVYFSISTPTVFREIEMPADETLWTSGQRKRFERLERLAEQHGTSVGMTTYRLG